MRRDTVEWFQRVDRRWDWHRLDAFNGQIIATSGGQGYEDEGECKRMARRVNGRLRVKYRRG